VVIRLGPVKAPAAGFAGWVIGPVRAGRACTCRPSQGLDQQPVQHCAGDLMPAAVDCERVAAAGGPCLRSVTAVE